jgi:peroxiredoxin
LKKNKNTNCFISRKENPLKKYAILLIGMSMMALGGLQLSLTGCKMLQWDSSGNTYPSNAPDVAADLVYGYKLIHVGETFPDTTLQAPENLKDRSYLGLETESAFSIKDIQADMVLVAMLNIHCMPCQEEALVYNDLFEQIEADASLRDRIKILGVGVGNNETEIKAFHEEYTIRFPIVPDLQFELHAAVGEPGTPFSVLVRLEKETGTEMVALTYPDAAEGYESIYQDMTALLTLDLAEFRKRGLNFETKVNSVEPVFSQSEIAAQVKTAMAGVIGAGGSLKEFQKLLIGDHHMYTGISDGGKETKRLFAEVISRPTLCDVCHDVHFFYIINEKGAVLDFVPLQLTKWGNENWSEKDVQLMRERLKGRFIFTPFYFNPQLDAVTSATITSVVIFNELSRKKELFDLLKQEGLIS